MNEGDRGISWGAHWAGMDHGAVLRFTKHNLLVAGKVLRPTLGEHEFLPSEFLDAWISSAGKSTTRRDLYHTYDYIAREVKLDKTS